ncbi:uncharacterized protein LOC106693944 [Microplitis demolitor]|uniref:uncharacterized protein LOC106693944 n=1 Tax=Microplitis demolitor TaxID=69319 RepID=UPI00235B67B0|nr:uncharacterized protein LOC106693944 [Microplitis demolitor]
MDVLGPIITKIFPDSKIAKNLSMKRTKTTATVKSLSKILMKNLCDDYLQIPGTFFSLIMDETTDTKNIKQCAFTVIYYDESTQKITTKFFDLAETDEGDAEGLYSLLENAVTHKKIPLDNFIGFSSDTTNVKVGDKKSIFALLKQNIDGIVTVKCSCHMIHLVASKACAKLSKSAEDLLRNLGSYFHRSWKRIKELQEFQEYFEVKIHRVLSPSNTRWLSLKSCVDRILEQYTPLQVYLQGQLLKDPSPTLQTMLKTMDNRFTFITLQFLSYTLGVLTDFNLMFQTEKPVLHKVKPEIENLMKDICSNYMDIAYIRKNDIFNVDHKNPRLFVPLDKIYIGLDANESLLELIENNEVQSSDVIEFRNKILNFYIEVISEIKKRFDFSDSLYTFLQILEPKQARSYTIKSLGVILKRFPVLQKYVVLQELDNEWKKHALLNLSDYGININSESEDYWKQIFNLKNADGQVIFENLKKVINFLLILPFSNASVERIFSDVKNIKTDHRNNLSTETLKSILITKNFISKDSEIINFEPTNEMIDASIWEN